MTLLETPPVHGVTPAHGQPPDGFPQAAGVLGLLLSAIDLAAVREATVTGMDGFIVDWERRGEHRRQTGEGTQINDDTLEDLQRVRAATSARVRCRVNGFRAVDPRRGRRRGRAGRPGRRVTAAVRRGVQYWSPAPAGLVGRHLVTRLRGEGTHVLPLTRTVCDPAAARAAGGTGARLPRPRSTVQSVDHVK